MKKIIIFLLQIIFAQGIYAQIAVGKRWDARFGGTGSDDMVCLSQTKDGGFVLGGSSFSGLNGDKTQPNWDTTLMSDDYWIVKADSLGHKQWDRRYGGTDGDNMMAVQQTADGGYILGGTSYSSANGDKTQVNWGDGDFWIIKVDSAGAKQWDRRYGGTSLDEFTALQQTRDGGYILGGYTNSPVSGDITEPNRDPSGGTDDYWIIKIDSVGNKQWDSRFGSNTEDVFGYVQQTTDGGYIMGGYSFGDSSGDKTQGNYGSVDYWIVKTDSAGNKQWDGDYGGHDDDDFEDLVQTPNGEYMLGGTSYSGISGDKTAAICGYWLVRIDRAGNKLGDWVYGSGLGTGSGTCAETFGSMSLTNDGGYLLTGVGGQDTGVVKTSASFVSGANVWTIKIDSLMNRVWDKTALSTSGQDRSAGALESLSGCYAIGVSTMAGIGGDKSQPNWDPTDASYDYWIVEFCDTVLTGIQEPVGDMHLLVYPNPTTGDLTINISKDNLKEASYTLTNSAGQVIYQATADHLSHSYTKILDLTALPQGIYSIAVTVDGERIIKESVKE